MSDYSGSDRSSDVDSTLELSVELDPTTDPIHSYLYRGLTTALPKQERTNKLSTLPICRRARPDVIVNALANNTMSMNWQFYSAPFTEEDLDDTMEARSPQFPKTWALTSLLLQ